MSNEKQTLARGEYLQLVRRGRWEYCERVNSSGVAVLVPVTNVGEVVLVSQHRMAVDAQVLEWPAGLVGDEAEFIGESIETAAARELFEETGFKAQQLELLFRGPPSAGMSAELPYFFLATDLERLGPGGGDEHEDITVHIVPFADIDIFIKTAEAQGMLVEAKLYSGLYFAQQYIAQQCMAK